MSERQAFLDAIATNLEDDTSRLVFADWLEENGEEEWAGFIRAHVQLLSSKVGPKPQKPKDRPAWRKESVGWQQKMEKCRIWMRRVIRSITGSTQTYPHFAEFNRGFLSQVRCTWGQWLKHQKDYLKLCPPPIPLRIDITNPQEMKLTLHASTAEYSPVKDHHAVEFIERAYPQYFLQIEGVEDWELLTDATNNYSETIVRPTIERALQRKWPSVRFYTKHVYQKGNLIYGPIGQPSQEGHSPPPGESIGGSDGVPVG